MRPYYERCVEYGGKWSRSTTFNRKHDQIVLEKTEIATVIKALRRGSKEDRELAKEMFWTLSGNMRCPVCGHLAKSLRVCREGEMCVKCYLVSRLREGKTITKDDARRYFLLDEYKLLAENLALDERADTLYDFYGYVDEDIEACMEGERFQCVKCGEHWPKGEVTTFDTPTGHPRRFICRDCAIAEGIEFNH